jgi:hypothetical protein
MIHHLRHPDLGDAGAVDQVFHRDQHILDKHGMVRREEQVALRFAHCERIGHYAYRPNLVRSWVVEAIDPAMAEPHDRHGSAIKKLDVIANLQGFNDNLATVSRDPRTGDEARRRTVHRYQSAKTVVRRDLA